LTEKISCKTREKLLVACRFSKWKGRERLRSTSARRATACLLWPPWSTCPRPGWTRPSRGSGKRAATKTEQKKAAQETNGLPPPSGKNRYKISKINSADVSGNKHGTLHHGCHCQEGSVVKVKGSAEKAFRFRLAEDQASEPEVLVVLKVAASSMPALTQF
jgi:hypothetical protein